MGKASLIYTLKRKNNMETKFKIGDKVRITPKSTHIDEIKVFYNKDLIIEDIEQADEMLYLVKGVPGCALESDLIKI